MLIQRSRTHRRPSGFSLEALEDRRVLATIAGQVVHDLNGNNSLDADEPGIQGVHVFIDSDGNDLLDRNGTFIEPDDFAANQQLTVANRNVLLSLANKENEITASATDDNPSARAITAEVDSLASTGSHVFGYDAVPFFHGNARLRIDFLTSVSSVAIDFTGSRTFAGESGVLELYDAEDNQLAATNTALLLQGESETLFATAENVAYAVAYTGEAGGGTGRLDNLRINAEGSELWTVTGNDGRYEFEGLDPAVYDAGIVRPTNWNVAFPESNPQTVDVSVDSVLDADFGLNANTIQGLVFSDSGVAGTYEPDVDTPVAGAIIYLDENSNGELDRAMANVEPDTFSAGSVITDRSEGMTISTADFRDVPRAHASVAEGTSTTGPRVFATSDGSSFTENQRLRIDFDNSVTSVSIDFISTATEGKGQIRAYRHGSEEPLGIDSSLTLSENLSATLTASTEFPQIDYVIIYADAVDVDGAQIATGNFDNLQVDGLAREPIAVTDATGRFAHTPLEDSIYNVRQELRPGQANSNPADGVHRELVEFGQTTELEFGVIDLSWQNKINNLDVNNDGFVVPFDVLEIINELNNPRYSDSRGELPMPPNPVPKFFDVNDDGFVSPFDAVTILNFLNSQGEGERPPVAAAARSAAAIDAVHAAAILDLDDDEKA